MAQQPRNGPPGPTDKGQGSNGDLQNVAQQALASASNTSNDDSFNAGHDALLTYNGWMPASVKARKETTTSHNANLPGHASMADIPVPKGLSTYKGVNSLRKAGLARPATPVKQSLNVGGGMPPPRTPNHELVSPLRKMDMGNSRYEGYLAARFNRETVPSLREDSPVTFGELPAGVSLEVDTSSMHAAANGNLNLTLTEPAAFSDFDAHSAMDLDTSAGQRGTPRYGSPRSAPVFALDSDDDDHGTQYESARSTPGLVNDSDDDDSDNSVSQQANESEDASAEAMVTPNERTTRKVKTGRISKKKPAKEKKVRDLSHLMARPFAPKLNTKPRQKPDPLPKFRVNNRPGTKFDRALRARQEKANQSGILVERCVETAENGGNVDEFLAKLRYELHALEHYDFVWEETIRDGTKLMQEGFPTILANPIFPWDIKGDARMIRTRWAKGDFDAHLLRGIATSKPRGEAPKSMVSNVIEKDYPHGSSAAVMGAKDLQNGQWWPKQICAVRDGAHGALMEGIFGISGKGAYSIVMSGSGYSDVDEGDVIKYCGTSGQASGPTPSTKRMMESWENGNPVRVLRSSGMKKNHSDYRPSAGIRYDGLYKVAESELLDAGTSMYRFTLRRCDGQDPIRYQGVEVKPHGHDANEYIRLYQK